MRKLQKMFKVTGLVLFIIGISFVQVTFAETTATFAATCYMPSYVTLSSGEKVLAENQQNEQETIAKTQEKEESYVSNTNPNLIQLEEEITREDNSQTELITTVCAK